MRKRSKLKIIMDILAIANGGANKTKIIYSANLNFNRANKYLEELTELGLIAIENVNGRMIYKTSEKGREFLKKCRELELSIDL